jgi:signal transduction histidine kinase/ActR/RegA family two-component response regulator
MDLAVSEARVDDRRIFAGVVRDATDRKRHEAERARLLESERAARAEAERATRLKDEFLAMVSHELRTPLTAIRGWTKMLQKKPLDDAGAAKALQVIERSARAQQQMIEDLLDVSRVVSGKLRLEMRPTSLSEVVEDALTSLRPTAEVKHIALEHDVEEGVMVHGDAARLQQVVWNLVANAIKFTPRAGRVRVRLRRHSDAVNLVVSDTGQGISADFLPHVFERFMQADSSIRRAHRGLGLGLALVRHITELHGGAVRAASPGEGAGATFTVSLPAAAAGELGAAAPCDMVEGVRALVVDDDDDSRELVRRMLEACGVHVATASSALEALAEVARWRPDVLLCDIGMPEMDGYQLLRAIRTLPPEQGGETPAAAVTAYARPEDHQQTIDAGYAIHVTKPVEPVQLLEAVARLAGRRAA